MKRLSLSLYTLTCSVFLLCANVVAAPADLLPRTTKFERVEGTITATYGLVTTRARLQFQAPDKLRIDVERDEAALVPAQTIVAGGNETRLYNAATKRLQRLPYNITKAWWRGGDLQNGGPANLLVFGLGQPDLERFYALENAATTQPNVKALRLNARPEIGRYWVQEYNRFGGKGDNAFYAAFKRALFDRPARIEITFDANTGAINGLRSINEMGRTIAATQLTIDPASNLPKAAITRDSNNRQIAQFNYDLKVRADAFDANLFQLDLVPGQIIEDLELKPISTYEAGQGADTSFNLGMAQAQHAEDFPAAFAAWDNAARLQPQAVAPHFAAYDAAMAARDLRRADQAVDRLGQLLGANDIEVATRRASIATNRRDWADVQVALDAAQRAQPQNLSVTLLRADLARARGNLVGARSLLLDILKSAAPQPASQIAAAEMLAASTVNPSDTREADTLLATLPRATQWQRLAHAHLSLLMGKEVTETAFDNDAAQASLAFAYEREGKNDAAHAIWQQLASRGLQQLADLARVHLMGLQAHRGNLAESLKLYNELITQAPDEDSRRRIQDALLASWRKVFKQAQLRAALQQRVFSANATDEDWRLWLAYQETHGRISDIVSAVQSGVARFPRVAWWQSRWAEILTAQANEQPATGPGLAASTQLMRSAFQAVQAAIAVEPTQPLYQTQRALILTQVAAARNPIIDSRQTVANLKAARDSLNALLTTGRGDPDTEIAVAVQRLALDPGNLAPVIQGLQQALRGGTPGRETIQGDRHATVSSARQALASALRRYKRPAEAAQQYEILLDSVRDSGAELAIARNYSIVLGNQKNARAIANLMIRLAREPWAYAGARQLIDGFASSLLDRQPLALQVAQVLHDSADPGAQLAATHLDMALVQLARKQAAAKDAKPEAATFLGAATRSLQASIQSLPAITRDQDKLLAGRAAVILAEDALSNRQPAAAIPFLKIAVEAEPRDFDLRLALATAYRLNNQVAETTAVRNDILAILPHSPENLRRLAGLSSSLNLPNDALRLAVQAMNMAQSAPDASPAQLEMSAFAAARSLFDTNQTPRAVEIYENLASAQWDIEDRAAALIDMEQRQRRGGRVAEADKIVERITALNLTPAQMRTAQRFLRRLD